MSATSQALSVLSRVLRGAFLLLFAYPIPLLLLLPTAVLASVISRLSAILSFSTWHSIACSTIVLGYTYFTVRIIFSIIFSPIFRLLKDTQTYWIARNVWAPRYLSTTLNITACVGAILGACALAYSSSELAPDMLLFAAAIWVSVLSVLVQPRDIDAAGRYLSRRQYRSFSRMLLAKWRPLLLPPGISIGLAGTMYLLAGPARLELDIWFLALLAWFGLFNYAITAGDWMEIRKFVGRRWGMVWVVAIAMAVFGAGGVQLVEGNNEVAKEHNWVIS